MQLSHGGRTVPQRRGQSIPTVPATTTTTVPPIDCRWRRGKPFNDRSPPDCNQRRSLGASLFVLLRDFFPRRGPGQRDCGIHKDALSLRPIGNAASTTMTTITRTTIPMVVTMTKTTRTTEGAWANLLIIGGSAFSPRHLPPPRRVQPPRSFSLRVHHRPQCGRTSN